MSPQVKLDDMAMILYNMISLYDTSDWSHGPALLHIEGLVRETI